MSAGSRVQKRMAKVKGLESKWKEEALQWNGEDKECERNRKGSRALGKEYRTHGCHESEDMWQPCGR